MKYAAKWSSIGEVCAKLIAPVTNAILARLLIPETFGVVATLTVVISFAEIFTDAGFQKYLVQHEFAGEEDLELSTNVAFWTNLLLSLVLWAGIAIFATPHCQGGGLSGMRNRHHRDERRDSPVGSFQHPDGSLPPGV